jgi:hypothetical protein
MTIEQERDYWRGIASYLASCHAATAEYDGSLSGVSKARKKRLSDICEKAAQALDLERGGFWPHNSTDPQRIKERCLDAMHTLRGTRPD